jgi:hypothetical protein
MNIHIVTEGAVGEKAVYRHWIPLVNPELTYVSHISETQNNNFSILSGGGYPRYLEIIDTAIADVNDMHNIDRLVIAVDSEEMSYQEKLDEIEQHIKNSKCHVEIKIIIQHFCLETWALGNRIMMSRKIKNEKLRTYVRLFNVRINDPELLPSHNQEKMNRAQFALKYLKLAMNEKYKQLSYSKSNPGALLNDKYFARVKERLEQADHIQSFQSFIDAFQ